MVLGAVGVRQWRARRDNAGAWVALAFASLAVVVIVGRIVPQHPHGFGALALQRLDIALLVLFPYLLFRFTMAFGDPSRRLYRFVSAMSVALVLWTFALPHIPASGENASAVFTAYLVVFLVHWAVLSVACAWLLWKAGGSQPTVARRRMQLLSFASAALTIALVLVASTTNERSAVAAVGGLLGTVSAVGFLLGLAPPSALRYSWRRPEQRRVQEAIGELMTLAKSQEEIAARVLEPAAAIVGAEAIAIRNDEGRVLGLHGHPPAGEAPTVVEMAGGSLLVWTTPYAPYFGGEELAMLRTLGSLTGLALDRVRLFEQEHATRLELERANQVKTNFVALAAHELRTPVTTINGFVQTLYHLGDRLGDAERQQVREALSEQTERMTLLVEQLLDLSRLDADAIEIHPQRMNVRSRVEEIVRGAAGTRSGAVEVHVADELEASVDPNAFDRIVSNLVVNAFRYGAPPVIVSAQCSDRHLRLDVEDRGKGVSPEFVPDLFERFSRSESSRATAGGTGLGLAIARSYALAHDGDLLYEPAAPHGARFRLVLPAQPAAA